MRTQAEIEREVANLTEAYVQSADTWNEAALAALDWALGNSDSRPSAD